MRVNFRGMIVGLLLGLAAMVGGCQPVQSVSATTAHASEIPVESEPVADSGVISNSVAIVADVGETPTVSSASSEPLTETVEVVAMTMPDVAIESVDPALLEAGMATYRAQYCGVCHTLAAAETHGTFGPEHDGMGAIAAARIADSSYSGAATTPAEYVRESIVEPHAYIVSGYATTSHRMPSYAHLDAATLDGLIAFLLSQ